MLGVDIDSALIEKARRSLEFQGSTLPGPAHPRFPASFSLTMGPLPAVVSDGGSFPSNVVFKTENFLESKHTASSYDTILCLNITKYVQLNWGDAGIRQLFVGVYNALRPGGLFVLQSQPWTSYRRKRNLTKTTRRHYDEIVIRPDAFNRFGGFYQ